MGGKPVLQEERLFNAVDIFGQSTVYFSVCFHGPFAIPRSHMISIIDHEEIAKTSPAIIPENLVPISAPATITPPEIAAITSSRRVEAKEVAPHL